MNDFIELLIPFLLILVILAGGMSGIAALVERAHQGSNLPKIEYIRSEVNRITGTDRVELIEKAADWNEYILGQRVDNSRNFLSDWATLDIWNSIPLIEIKQ